MRIKTENKYGEVEYKNFSGTAQLLCKISDKIYTILTCAHNFYQIKEGIKVKGVKSWRYDKVIDATFWLQQDGPKSYKV